MARYNTFKYGQAKYGATASSTLPAVLWTFIVDWDGDGYFSGENEATRMTNLTVTRGRDNLVKPDGNGWERYSPGQAVAMLDNSDGRYDPWNTSSPLYPNVTPGKFVRIRALDPTDGSNYNVMRGIISNIQPYSDGAKRKAIITVTDGLQWLKDRKLRMGLRQNETFGGTISHILNLTGFPRATEWPVSNPNNGKTNSRVWYWDESALDAIWQLCDSEAGQVLHNRLGQLGWIHGQFTHSGTLVLDESDVLRDIQIPQPWEVVRNSVQIRSYQKVLFPVNTKLWDLPDNTLIPPGGEVTFDAEFDYVPANNVLRDICGASVQFSFTANANEDGSGADQTPNCSLIIDSNEIGQGATITVRNGTIINAYLRLLTATGDVIYAPFATTVRVDDAASQALYGIRSFFLDARWIQGPTYNVNYANWVLSQLKDPKKFPIVQIENRPSIQFARDIYYDRIQFTSPTLGITGDFRIGKIEHQWINENGITRTTWKLEPYLTPF